MLVDASSYNKYRVLFLNFVSGLEGGAEKSLLLLLKDLDRIRYEPFFVVPGDGDLKKEAEKLNIRTESLDLIHFNGKNLFSFFKGVRQLSRFCRENKIDLIHSNSWAALQWAVPVGFVHRISVICHFRDLVFSRRKMLRLLLKRTKLVIAISQAVKDKLIQAGVNDEKIVVVHNGVDLKEFNQYVSRRTESAYDEKKPVVAGMASRLLPWKGQRYFIEAAARVVKDYPKAQFHIAGEPAKDELQYKEELIALTNRLDLNKNVHFLGHHKDIPEIMSGFDFLVLTSDNEPFGRVLIEAMALGKPVVAFAGGGASEIIDDNINGFLVPQGDVEALAVAMKKLIANRDLIEALGNSARKKVENCFSAKHYVTTVERIYQSVLENTDKTKVPGIYVYRKKTNRLIFTFMDFFGYNIYLPLSKLFGQLIRKKRIELKDVEKILVVRLAHIGDVLFTTPSLGEIRRLFPDAHITYLTGSWSKQILEGNPRIDEIITFDSNRHNRNSKDKITLKKKISFIRGIRKRKFDVLINLGLDVRDNLFSYFFGIPLRFGGSGAGLGFLFTKAAPYLRKKHDLDANLDIIKLLGGSSENRKMEIWISDTDRVYVGNLFDEYGITEQENFIVIHPGVGDPQRQWPPEYFAETADRLADMYGAKIIIIGGKNDKNLALRIRELAAVDIIDLSGRTALRQTAELVRRANLLIGLESSSVHIAAAVGTPTIAVFSGFSDTVRWAVCSDNTKVVKNELSCSNECEPDKCSTKECMLGIKPEVIVSLAGEFLGCKVDADNIICCKWAVL